MKDMFELYFKRSELINEFFFGDPTETERAELDRWLLESGNQQWFEGLQDENWFFTAFDGFVPRDSQETFATVQKRIQQGNG